VDRRKIIIAIICSNMRADAIAEIFSQNLFLEIYRIQSVRWKVWNLRNQEWNKLDDKDYPKRFDLLFHHKEDGEINEHIPEGVELKKIVRFSTDDTRYTASLESGICGLPPFQSYYECPITENDVEEFLQWVRGERIEPPSICTEERNTLERILSLSVLCSGYLPVHAVYKKRDKDWKTEDIKAALDQMGWYEFLKILDKDRRDDLVSKFKKQKDVVRDAKRWRDTFDIPEENPETAIQELVKNIKIEWDEKRFGQFPQEVYSLLLKMKNREIAPPKLVADAFCAIAKRLKGR
jgi:hypothetical protein